MRLRGSEDVGPGPQFLSAALRASGGSRRILTEAIINRAKHGDSVNNELYILSVSRRAGRTPVEHFRRVTPPVVPWLRDRKTVRAQWLDANGTYFERNGASHRCPRGALESISQAKSRRLARIIHGLLMERTECRTPTRSVSEGEP